MKQSIERVLKFLGYLIIMFCIVYALMLLTGMAEVKIDEFGSFLATRRGQLMIVAILGLSVLYPFYGVISKKIVKQGTADIVISMEKNGYKMILKEDKKMAFIPVRFVDRLKLRFDDRLDIDNSGDVTVIKGSRRAVYSVLYKLGGDVM